MAGKQNDNFSVQNNERESSREIQGASSSGHHVATARNPFDAMLSGMRWRRAARWIGLLIFVIGAGLLAYVFWQALIGFGNFAKPDYLSLQMRRVQGDGGAEAILAGVIVLGTEFLRVVYLLLLGLLGSMIASRGIQFFMASESVIDEAVMGNMDDV